MANEKEKDDFKITVPEKKQDHGAGDGRESTHKALSCLRTPLPRKQPLAFHCVHFIFHL